MFDEIEAVYEVSVDDYIKFILSFISKNNSKCFCKLINDSYNSLSRFDDPIGVYLMTSYNSFKKLSESIESWFPEEIK